MKKICFRLLHLGVVLLLGTALAAQSSGQWQADDFGTENPAKKAIKGKVIDAATKQGLEYATITLFSLQDSAMVTGGITDFEGSFKIEAVAGLYFAKVEFISYKPVVIADIVIDENQSELDLGIIEMEVNTAVLDLVEVRADKSQMQIALDKRVFNVGKDLANRGGTAEYLLDNIPSVAVDIDGNVSLRGNGNVRILIDGKPSGLIGVGDNNGLRQIPSNMIDRVEVITNPSARYEAEGVAGIINIILKKDSNNGLNGSFDVSVGYPESYGAAVNMNYRKKSINFFGTYGLDYRTRQGGGYAYQEFYKNDSTFILDQHRDHERTGLSNTFRFGLDYYINPKNTLTGALTYQISDENNFAKIEYNDYINDYPGNFQGVTYRTDDEKEDESSLEYSLNYKKTFSKEDHVLTANIRYEDDIETEQNKYLETFYGSDYLPTGEPDLQQRGINKELNKEWQLQLDYVHPFSKDGKFEAGWRSSIREINNDFVVEELDDIVWDTLYNLSNNFIYDEKIHAAYSSIGNKHGRFSYIAGVRAELSNVITELVESDSVNDREYLNFFPTLHLTYELPGQNAIQVSYSRRINRPNYRDLNPFLSYSDSRNLYQGNPELDPEFTNSIEVGHIKYWNKATLSSFLYYRHTEGLVQRIREVVDDNGNTVNRPENLATEDAYGIEATFTYSPLEWWKLDGDLNFYRSIVDGSNVEESLESDYFSWFGRISSRMTILKSMDTQLRFNYRAPTETTQGSEKAMYFLDVSISKDILKGNGTITLNVIDLFNTRMRRYTTFGDDFYSKGEFQWRTREIKLTLNYRLNQMKKKSEREGGNFEGEGGGGF